MRQTLLEHNATQGVVAALWLKADAWVFGSMRLVLGTTKLL